MSAGVSAAKDCCAHTRTYKCNRQTHTLQTHAGEINYLNVAFIAICCRDCIDFLTHMWLNVAPATHTYTHTHTHTHTNALRWHFLVTLFLLYQHSKCIFSWVGRKRSANVAWRTDSPPVTLLLLHTLPLTFVECYHCWHYAAGCLYKAYNKMYQLTYMPHTLTNIYMNICTCVVVIFRQY